ncbi:uncharacterized protein DUF4013 [Methanothermobacter defluvii]|uniref:Uncharacterized protein DUF4013 n=1 Tax=Methanothermobacter defluvii TaxID=49339 RepID=A0A371NDY4_9EURY|nr:DUF4013 domain-containing protein [Methanothermobacter defluvii]REE28190.1 uncharacterized protein DUF4013 [Methanothermobacter defluvii]
MDIGEIVNDAIRYPSSDWKKVIILGVLIIASILILPVFLVMGYGFRALKASIAGFDELPEFDEWGEMFVDGLKVFVVQIAYMIVPLIIIFAGVLGSFTMVSPDTGVITNPTAFTGLVGGTTIIGIILAIILGLIETIAIAHMAYNDSELGAAFRFSEILDVISQIGWLDYIIWYIVVGLISVAGLHNLVHRCGSDLSGDGIHCKFPECDTGSGYPDRGPHNIPLHPALLEQGPCTQIRLRIKLPSFFIFPSSDKHL